MFSFKRIQSIRASPDHPPPLTKVSYLGSVCHNELQPQYCDVCKPSPLNAAAVKVCAMEEEKRKKGCCEKIWEQNGYEYLGICEQDAPRKRNPIWTGDDVDQIGIFLRNVRIEAVNEENQTISLHFIINVVWLDKELCTHFEEKKKLNKKGWFIEMSKKEYLAIYKAVRSKRVHRVDNPATIEERYQNPFPNIKIWNGTIKEGFELREEVISLNKPHIGPNTVYWRRIIRMKLICEYTSKGFPFGYETFKMSIRLMSRTDQHLVLLRTRLWRDMHRDQCDKKNEILVDHTFAYLHPDNKGLKDWKVISVHANEEKFYSEFDNNDLTLRLPVRVTDGKNTQSRYEALIVLKRKPKYIIWNIWIYFTLTTVLSLLAYQIDPVADLPDRLAITVAIIFVQMGLKWDSSRKTARVSYVTGLDMHIFLSIILVVGQAIVLVFSVFICKQSGDSDKNIKEVDVYLSWISTGLVFIANLGTVGLSRKRQKWARVSLEEILKNFSGFNKYPLSGYAAKEIGDRVRIKGRKSDDMFQTTTNDVNQKVETRNTIYPDYCRSFNDLSNDLSESETQNTTHAVDQKDEKLQALVYDVTALD